MGVAFRVGWAWDVEFARWVSHDTTALKVQVVAEDPHAALVEAHACADRMWGTDSVNLSVRRLSRRDPVNGVAAGQGTGRGAG